MRANDVFGGNTLRFSNKKCLGETLFGTSTHAHGKVSCVRLGVGNPKPTMCYGGDPFRAQQHPSDGYFARSGVRRPTLVLVMCWWGGDTIRAQQHTFDGWLPRVGVRRPHTRSFRCPPPHTRGRDVFFGGHSSGPATHIRKLLCSFRCPPAHTCARGVLGGGHRSGPATHVRRLLVQGLVSSTQH
jgi:hypothetical protein